MQEKRQPFMRAVAVAMLFAVIGFLFFLKPHLGGQAGAASTAIADAQTIAAGKAALSSTTPEAFAAALQALASANGISLSTVQTGVLDRRGPAISASFLASGETQGLLSFAAALGASASFEGDQLRASGPLYLVDNFKLTAQRGKVSAAMTVVTPKR